MHKEIKKIKNSGFVILFAVTIAAILLSIALGVANIALKETKFSTNARDTNDAFFAADTGIECAFFNNKPPGLFPIAGPAVPITCASNTVTPTISFLTANSTRYDFTLTGLGSAGLGCAKVSVLRDNSNPAFISDTIDSKGYNIGDSNCNSTNSDRVERQLTTTGGGMSQPLSPSGFAHHRMISINSGQVSGGGPLANFPVLVSFTDSTLKNGSGGSVQSAVGTDIVFTSDSDGNVVIPYEKEKYDPATGQIIYWVNIASLTNTSTFYMFYSKAGATDQSNPAGVWDSNYKGVWHLPNGTSLISPTLGSTSGGLGNGTVTSATASTGKIDGGANFAGSAQIDFGTPNLSSYSALTASIWIKATAPQTGTIFTQWSDTVANASFIIDALTGTNKARGYVSTISGIYGVTNATAVVADGNWHLITLVWSASGNSLRLYVDGVQTGSTVSTAGSNLKNAGAGGTHLWLGRYTQNLYYTGDADEARISNTARLAPWIVTEYNNQSNPSAFYTMGAEQTP